MNNFEIIVIANLEVNDANEYRKYEKGFFPILKKYNGSFIVRGGEQITTEGECFSRNVVVEFPSYEIAIQAYHSKEYQEALIHFNKALEYDPENSSAMFRLGNIYYAIRDYVLAAEHLEKGLQYQKNNYKVLYMLGRCYGALSDNEKSLSAYKMALDFNPTYTKASFEIANLIGSSAFPQTVSPPERCANNTSI